jgi:uncharacterized protein
MIDSPPPAPPNCPICKKPAALPHVPFCSARCKQVDLHRWMSEVYKIETPEPPSSANPQQEDEYPH